MSNITSPVLQNSKRPAEPTYPVWDLEGNKHQMTRQNINDKVRHCGWYQRDPSYMVEQARIMQERAAGMLAAAAKTAGAPVETAVQPTAAQEAVPQLTLLRKALSDAGGIPDPTWGVARLEAAIAAKKAGVPLPKDPDDDE